MMFWLIFFLTILTRLIGLKWGFPYYFHPDENNLATSLNQLSCPNVFDFKNCFEPGFYAYGHLSIYLAKILMLLINNANYSLRLLSAISSIIAAIFFYRLINKDFKSKSLALIGLIYITFTPIFIQLAHFGTTESLLMLLVILILYFRTNNLLVGLLIGIAMAIKISSAVLLILPFLFFKPRFSNFKSILSCFFLALISFFLLTPHYWLNFSDWISSLNYELAVGSGQLPVFYTQQFASTIPLLFQIKFVLPYSLGLVILFLSLIGFIYLYQAKKFIILSIFLVIFVFSSLSYVKWTRFLALSYPLWLYLATAGQAFLLKHVGRPGKVLSGFLIIGQLFIGLNFFRIYLVPDTRVQASSWLQTKISHQKLVLSESGNVIDLPLSDKQLQVNNYWLYDLDSNSSSAKIVFSNLSRADYIIVPSRRVFMNYSCFFYVNNQLQKKDNCLLAEKYPFINQYYQTLFASKKFKLIKTFSILNDEFAEETISVFDHPTIRIYQRTIY